MLSKIQKSIIISAVEIRLKNGEKIDTILDSYPRLSDEELSEIKQITMNNKCS